MKGRVRKEGGAFLRLSAPTVLSFIFLLLLGADEIVLWLTMYYESMMNGGEKKEYRYTHRSHR